MPTTEPSQRKRTGTTLSLVRRWLRRLAVCILAGVVGSIGLAWGRAAWGYDLSRPLGRVAWLPDPGVWDIDSGISEHWGFSTFWRVRSTDAGKYSRLSVNRLEANEETRRSDREAARRKVGSSQVPGWAEVPDPLTISGSSMKPAQSKVLGFGWPRVCVSGWLVTPPREDPRPLQRVHFICFPEGKWYHNLPIRIYWPGLLFNTVVFGGPLFAIIAIVSGVRWLRRSQAGCCVNCGYQLAGLREGVVCPECGSSQGQPSA